jgi:hypothetical protein
MKPYIYSNTVTQCKGKQRKDVENPPNGSEENQVFGKPSVAGENQRNAQL